MTTIRALPDGGEEGLALLGELHAVKGAPVGEMRILKKISIPGAGSYDKTYPAPLYDRQVMEEVERRSQGKWSFSKKNCLGMLAKKGGRTLGYVRRRVGMHDLCLPVYDPAHISPLGWKVKGYLPAGEEGYVTVLGRRTGYWVWLTLGAILAFLFSYLLFTAGFWAIVGAIRDLPQTLTDGWFWLMHRWGVL